MKPWLFWLQSICRNRNRDLCSLPALTQCLSGPWHVLWWMLVGSNNTKPRGDRSHNTSWLPPSKCFSTWWKRVGKFNKSLEFWWVFLLGKSQMSSPLQGKQVSWKGTWAALVVSSSQKRIRCVRSQQASRGALICVFPPAQPLRSWGLFGEGLKEWKLALRQQWDFWEGEKNPK